MGTWDISEADEQVTITLTGDDTGDYEEPVEIEFTVDDEGVIAISGVSLYPLGAPALTSTEPAESATGEPSLLAEFSRAHPSVEVEMHTGLAADMQEGLGSNYDILINGHPAGLGGGHLIRREQLHWVTSHHDSPHLNDPLPMAFLPPGSLVRNMAVSALGRADRSWRMVHESSNIASLLASAAAGWAVSVFQQSSLEISHVRILNESDGMPPLPQIDVRMEAAPRFLSRAAVELHRYLLASLVSAK